MMPGDLFAFESEPASVPLCNGAMLLRGFAAEQSPVLVEAVMAIAARSPFRHMITPGGFEMSVAMTNCGAVGWVSEPAGYRYDPIDPATGRPWPPMPDVFLILARRAAAEAGFSGFEPNACLVNRYQCGAKLSLHQDRDERDLRQPIVSVSLGVPAVFLFGGLRRKGPVRRIRVENGDVVVWGGPARLVYHGVAPLGDGWHPLTDRQRFNLTFRRAV